MLITVAQPAHQPPIADWQRVIVLEHLPGAEKWLQYPPASGRGHGFETRWWEDGQDAGTVAAKATERFLEAIDVAGLSGIEVVLVHVASPGDRLNEAVIGLERRQDVQLEVREWNVMLRAVAGSVACRSFPRASLDALLDRLRPDASGTGRDGLVEVRFWVPADDAVAATTIAAERFMHAMVSLGHDGWTIVRAHAASVAEASRAAYLGVERRVLAVDPASLPVAVRL